MSDQSSKIFNDMQGDKEYLRGVHGWLRWLVIVLMVLTPLMLLGGTNMEVMFAERDFPALTEMERWRNYKTFAWWLVVFCCTAYFFSGWMLLKHHVWSSVQNVIFLLWIIPVVASLGGVWGATHFLLLSAERAFANLSGESVRNLAASLVWTLYLLLSRRVKNTYRKHEKSGKKIPKNPDGNFFGNSGKMGRAEKDGHDEILRYERAVKDAYMREAERVKTKNRTRKLNCFFGEMDTPFKRIGVLVFFAGMVISIAVSLSFVANSNRGGVLQEMVAFFGF